eukprot:3830005-Alexandrium_andersonii.AAC.1
MKTASSPPPCQPRGTIAMCSQAAVHMFAGLHCHAHRGGVGPQGTDPPAWDMLECLQGGSPRAGVWSKR